MSRIEILLLALVFAVAAPVRAQDTDTPVEDAAEEMVEEADEAAEDAADAVEDVADEAMEDHDWEFALASTDKAPGASGNVLVDEEDGASAFAVAVTGLPEVDALDQEGRDVSTYTVWVVPSKDRVAESTLAGELTVDAQGAGRIAGTTPLETFGIIVTATPTGAPDRIGGVPVLTGIPVRQAAEEAEAAGDAAEDAYDEAADAVDEAGDVVEDATDDAPDAVEQAGDDFEEATEDAADALEDAGDEAEEAAEEAAEGAPDNR